MTNQKIIFVVNPKAGVKKKIDISLLIKNTVRADVNYDIVIWEKADDFTDITKKILEGGYTIAVAAGGDGTINKVAAVVNNTNIALGLLPLGSGNGLARTLGIPLKLEKAIERTYTGTATKIDSGEINGTPFFCTAGIGFDAHIAHLFATSTSRGLKTYISISLREFFNYKPKEYKIILNGVSQTKQAFLITLANAGQYGNDFYIAPTAKINDGLLHLVILKPFPLWRVLFIGIKILLKKANESQFIETFPTDFVKIIREDDGAIHYDGEPFVTGKEIEIKMFKQTLNVIA